MLQIQDQMGLRRPGWLVAEAGTTMLDHSPLNLPLPPVAWCPLPNPTVQLIVCARSPFAEKYAASQDAFFADYAQAHAKLSELGVEWVEGGPVTL